MDVYTVLGFSWGTAAIAAGVLVGKLFKAYRDIDFQNKEIGILRDQLSLSRAGAEADVKMHRTIVSSLTTKVAEQEIELINLQFRIPTRLPNGRFAKATR